MGGKRGRLITQNDRSEAIKLINEACASGARKQRACGILEVTVRTIERWERSADTRDRRKGATKRVANKLSDLVRKNVITIANSKEYCDLPPCKIVPLLADKNIYIASESSFYRILREEKQLAHRLKSRLASHKKPSPFIATAPNQVWTWDISYLPSQVKGLYFYLYLIMDIYSRKIVGWSVHDSESSEYAAQLIKQACIDEKVEQSQLVLHSDNGSPMKGATMMAMLENLGVIPSFSRPSVSNDNPYSEALFRTLKYCPPFPVIKKFETIDTAREWCEQFCCWYNNEHLHCNLKFITPNQRHSGEDKMIMENRHRVYQKARNRHPERWSGKIRNWNLPDAVKLNPGKVSKHYKSELLMAA